MNTEVEQDTSPIFNIEIGKGVEEQQVQPHKVQVQVVPKPKNSHLP